METTLDQSKVLIIDNYDSYAYNLFQAFGELTGNEPQIVRNNRVTLREIAATKPTHIVISPGPGNPESPAYFGVCREVILTLGPYLPVLGVCLGHQGIGYAFGGRVVHAPTPMHGKTSEVLHDSSPIFAGIESPFTAMRYHSLVIEPSSFPSKELEIIARTMDGIIMGVAHQTHPIVGLQFHPESIGTSVGQLLLRNFLRHGMLRRSFAHQRS